MQEYSTMKALPQVPNGKDVFLVCDLPGFADFAASVPESNVSRSKCRASNQWMGNKSYDDSVSQVRSGDLSGVAASDDLLDKIEATQFATQAWSTRLDVVGGIPNVPAYIAGHPYNMRRRVRVTSEQAPLAIFASLELSAGIDITTMRKRGAAILALVRLLSDKRPVELWACVSVGQPGIGAHALVRIDTAPLDLARAAHVLTCPSVTRGIGYAVCRELIQKAFRREWQGHWAYGDVDLYRRIARENFLRVVSPGSEALLLTAAHTNDPAVKTPLVWLENMLKEHGGIAQDDAA